MNIRHAAVFLGSLLAIAGNLTGPASAGHAAYAPIHVFCSEANCLDGAMPQSPLLIDPAGNLYGTAYAGGTGNCGTESCGTLFELTPKNNGHYAFSVLHDFCGELHCADGVLPMAGVIMGVNGHLYGVTSNGGQNDAGTAFEVVPRRHGTSGFQVLYAFCMQRPYCNDGAAPEYDGLTYQGATSGALYDGTSPLYGVGLAGGANGEGVVYALQPPTGAGKAWSESILYSFCAESGCADGALPQHALLFDAAGNFYGTTSSGGAYGYGVIFELSQSGGSWSETVLYSFCPGGDPCSDGRYPSGPLVMDSSGNIYGATANGGNNDNGVLFRLLPNGTNSTYTVVHTFCSLTGCADGRVPTGKLLINGSGDIIGVTGAGGGTHDAGVVYAFDGSKVRVLHRFCRASACTDGGYPIASGVSADTSGNLYGTASGGGNPQQFAGVVFRLTP